MSYELTKVTSTHPQTLTKRYSLKNGEIDRSTIASLSDGLAEVVAVETPSQFAEVLQALNHNQALCYGLPPTQRARILSKTKYEALGSPADATTRSKDVFKWPKAGGILLLDYDPQEGAAALSQTQLFETLKTVLPCLDTTAYVWWVSSSSLIYNTDTQEQLTPIKGQRVYIFVQDASDIERAGQVLFECLWLAGYGFYAISRAGTLLERSIVDASVWQTNRLDFAAGAQCVAPLEQQRGKPAIQDGQALDTRAALLDLTPEERIDLRARKQKEKAAVEPERAAVRERYIEETALEIVKANGKEGDENALNHARDLVRRAVDGETLAGDFVITLAGGATVTIGEVLDAPSQYHGALTLDPLEPEYGGRRTVGKLYLMGGRATLHSFAHGGRTFKLIRQPARIKHNKGTTADTTHRVVDFLRELPEVFDYGREIALVRSGRLTILNKDSLSFFLGSVAQFCEWQKDRDVNVDPPDLLLKQVLAVGAARGLKPLKAVINAPIIDVDGRVISMAGYDPKTQLYLDLQDSAAPVPDRPTLEQVRGAVAMLLQPFDGFQTASALDRSALLCAILTAIVRPILPQAPAIGLDAPVQGTGKTYLAQCLGVLGTGEVPPVLPHTAGRDDEETRKRIYSVLLAGDRVMVWDNILGHFDSVAMAALLTSDPYADRKLGASEKSELPNRLLVLLTGNNLAMAGDMPSRVLKIRLDAQLENPTTRKFKSDPLSDIKRNRQQLIGAALTIIKGYLCSDAHRMGGASDRGTRFKKWDALTRQPVAWLAKTCPELDYTDPAQVLEDAAANDPEKEALFHALTLLNKQMGAEWWTTSALLQRMRGGFHPAQTIELEEVLQDLAGSTKPLTSRGLGRILSYRVDRRVNGFQLLKRGTKNAMSYKVAKVSEPP